MGLVQLLGFGKAEGAIETDLVDVSDTLKKLDAMIDQATPVIAAVAPILADLHEMIGRANTMLAAVQTSGAVKS